MEPETLRLFVALEIPAAWREGVAREIARVARWDPHARTVPAENVHVTLAFLGATPAGRVAEVAAAMRAAADGVVAAKARLEGLGAFPSVERPRVVWAGLSEEAGAPPLAALASRLREALARAGFALDARERFHAHVTLARVERRPSAELEKGLTAGRLQSTYTTQMLSDLVLMVSHATPGGSRYRALERVALAGMPAGRDGSDSSAPSPGTTAPGERPTAS